MAWCLGGRFVEGELEKLRGELRNYYGTLNELREGLAATLPEKPEAMILWQQCKAMGLPVWRGGLMDQPHIFLLEIAVIREEELLFEIANNNAQPQDES